MRGKKRERIIRVLLDERRLLSKYALAKQAHCSFPWVHEFIQHLEQQQLVQGTRVIEPLKLLHYWQSIRQRPPYQEYMIQKPLELLKNCLWKYALTTYQGDNLVQHFLFPSRTDLYIREQDREKWHALLIKNGLYGKGNFRILLDDEHVFYHRQQEKGFTVVCTPQLILDLLQEGGVCTEAAERLLKRNNHVR